MSDHTLTVAGHRPRVLPAQRQRPVARLHRGLRRLPLALILPLLIGGSLAIAARPDRINQPLHDDGTGYFAWTDALLDGNIDFCRWHAVQAALSGRNPAHPQRCENKYPPALTLLRFPVMGPVALLSGPTRHGQMHISGADQDGTELCGLVALLAAAVLMWATLRRLEVGTRRAQAAVLALTFGTGLFHYGTFDASYSHIDSAALFAGLIYVGVSAAQAGRRPRAGLVFILSLFIAWIRQPDVLPLTLLVGVWLWHQTRPGRGAARARAVVRQAWPPLLAIILVVAVQVLYNHWSAGVWSLSSYGSEPFSLRQGDELEVLLSADHGLFTWYPVTALLLAVGFWHRRSRPWAWLALAAIALLAVIYGSWDPWDLAGSMGMRGMVDIVPVMALPAGVGLACLSRRALPGALAAGAVLTLVTVELMWGYWQGTIPIGGNTPAQYWQQVTGDHSLLHARTGAGTRAAAGRPRPRGRPRPPALRCAAARRGSARCRGSGAPGA